MTNITRLLKRLDGFDWQVTRWMAANGITLLRISLGVVFLWFGALKLVPGLSPAEDLVRTTLPFLPMNLFLPFLALWEMAIGVGFITGKFLRLTILLLFLQMPGTISPVLLQPDRVWSIFPFALTIEGQYIVKNMVLIAAGIVIGSTVRGGGLATEPNTTPVRPVRGHLFNEFVR